MKENSEIKIHFGKSVFGDSCEFFLLFATSATRLETSNITTFSEEFLEYRGI